MPDGNLLATASAATRQGSWRRAGSDAALRERGLSGFAGLSVAISGKLGLALLAAAALFCAQWGTASAKTRAVCEQEYAAKTVAGQTGRQSKASYLKVCMAAADPPPAAGAGRRRRRTSTSCERQRKIRSPISSACSFRTIRLSATGPTTGRRTSSTCSRLFPSISTTTGTSSFVRSRRLSTSRGSRPTSARSSGSPTSSRSFFSLARPPRRAQLGRGSRLLPAHRHRRVARR